MIPHAFEVELQNAVTDVLESMCFLSLLDQDAAATAAETPSVARRLDFRGSFSGSFGLRAPLETASIFAGNLLGQDHEELTEQEIGDSVGEIANMICGSFLCRLETKQPFDLTTPVVDATSEAGEGSMQRFTKDFVVEGGLLHTWLRIG